MTFQLEKTYFELNFQGQQLDYELKNGFYVRNVSEADLSVAYDDDNDSKFELYVRNNHVKLCTIQHLL